MTDRLKATKLVVSTSCMCITSLQSKIFKWLFPHCSEFLVVYSFVTVNGFLCFTKKKYRKYWSTPRGATKDTQRTTLSNRLQTKIYSSVENWIEKKKRIATVEFLIEFNDLIKLIRILHSCESAFRLILLIFNRQCKCKLVFNVTYKWISKWMSTFKTTLMANQLLQLTFCAELKCKLFNWISITVIMFTYYRYHLLLYDMQFSRKFRKP